MSQQSGPGASVRHAPAGCGCCAASLEAIHGVGQPELPRSGRAADLRQIAHADDLGAGAGGRSGSLSASGVRFCARVDDVLVQKVRPRMKFMLFDLDAGFDQPVRCSTPYSLPCCCRHPWPKIRGCRPAPIIQGSIFLLGAEKPMSARHRRAGHDDRYSGARPAPGSGRRPGHQRLAHCRPCAGQGDEVHVGDP